MAKVTRRIGRPAGARSGLGAIGTVGRLRLAVMFAEKGFFSQAVVWLKHAQKMLVNSGGSKKWGPAERQEMGRLVTDLEVLAGMHGEMGDAARLRAAVHEFSRHS